MRNNKQSNVTFEESYVHQGHYVYINGKYSGIVVNLFAYETITEYKTKVDKKIKEKLEGDKKSC